MQAGLNVRKIKEREGIDLDYTRKLCAKYAKKHNIAYAPERETSLAKSPPEGLTDISKPLRSRLADELYNLSRKTDAEERAVLLGLTRKQQKYARDVPFNHDWTISQIERLCVANNLDLVEFLVSSLIGTSRYNEVIKCLNR